ncbi:MAG: hypothetical protein RBT63_02255 [Bdellovibrionales bacterium]|nr:hypothetical protein [Bdellovibrionales bacterium]
MGEKSGADGANLEGDLVAHDRFTNSYMKSYTNSMSDIRAYDRDTFSYVMNSARKIALVFCATLMVGLPFGLPSIAFAQSEGTLEAEEMRSTPYETRDAGTASGATSESRASIVQTGWSQFKRDIRVRFFNFTSADMAQVHEDGGRLQTYNYFSLEYRLSRHERIAFRPAFTYNFAGSDDRGQHQDSEFAWSDSYINYANYSLRWLPFDLDYSTSVRFYLPTSESSQSRGTILRIRPYLIAGAPLTTRLSYAVHFQPDFYIQSRTGYANARGYANGNRNYGYKIFTEMNYRLTRVFSLGGSVGHDQMWHHEMPIENVDVYRTENMNIDASVGIYYGGLSTAIGVSQSRNLARKSGEFTLFNQDETQYFARSYYRF